MVEEEKLLKLFYYWCKKNFDAFMGIELSEGSLKGIHGKFYASEVFDNLPKDEVEEYNKNFPKLKKLRFPGQWD